jgi:hypothetical protein
LTAEYSSLAFLSHFGNGEECLLQTCHTIEPCMVLHHMCLSDSGEAEPSHDAICMRIFSVSLAPPPRTGGGATSHGLSPVRLSNIGKIYC